MRLWIALAAAAALLLAALPASADTVVLKDGRRMSGEIVADDAAGVQLKTRGITVTFKRDEIAVVEKGEAAAPASPDDPVAQRFAAAGVPEVDRMRRRAHGLLEAADKAAAEARKDRSDADGVRGQLEAVEKRIENGRSEREKLVTRYDSARAKYDDAASKCGSGG